MRSGEYWRLQAFRSEGNYSLFSVPTYNPTHKCFGDNLVSNEKFLRAELILENLKINEKTPHNAENFLLKKIFNLQSCCTTSPVSANKLRRLQNL